MASSTTTQQSQSAGLETVAYAAEKRAVVKISDISETLKPAHVEAERLARLKTAEDPAKVFAEAEKLDVNPLRGSERKALRSTVPQDQQQELDNLLAFTDYSEIVIEAQRTGKAPQEILEARQKEQGGKNYASPDGEKLIVMMNTGKTLLIKLSHTFLAQVLLIE